MTDPSTLGEPQTIEGLRAERDAAAAEARRLEYELGTLRARLKRLELTVWWINEPKRQWESLQRRLAERRAARTGTQARVATNTRPGASR